MWHGHWHMAVRVVLLAFVAVFVMSAAAQAKLTRISADSVEAIDLPAFGDTGPYLKIAGTFEGELDPEDARNAVIADIELAPRVDGKVQYRSTFFILRPVDLSKGNDKLFVDFGNRGNKRILQWFNDGTATNDPSTAEHFGNGYLMRKGYSVALNGWIGDAEPGPNVMSVELPVAVNPDGSSITGHVVAELVADGPDDTTIELPYEANSTDSSNGVLTVRERQTDPRVELAGWSYDDGRQISFPGPAKPGWIYEFVYTGKDPKVMGMGHAVTRDFLSFLRHEKTDGFGNPNPLATPSGLKAMYAWGRSNGGRVQRDFLRWGFNEDENGDIVIDGMLPYATGSGGLMWMNERFSQPTASSRKHERHYVREPEFPHTFPVRTDPLTGKTDGLLKRCLASGTCPKVFNLDGGNEYWNKSSSLNHTDAFGRDLDVDKLAPNVRLYSIAGTDHNTEFDEGPELVEECQQMTNPIYNGPVFRALSVAMDRWVSRGIKPPRSRVPLSRDGTLVRPELVRFRSIPATSYAGWLTLPAVEYTPEVMNRNQPLDYSQVPAVPIGDREYDVRVPQVDKDGNPIAGIRLPYLEVPLGTHTGWSLRELGQGYPDSCGQHGQFIPFAFTNAEREAAGDPRPSINERYRTHRNYVRAIARSAKRLVRKGFLLEEDQERIIRRAELTGVNLWLAQAPSQ